MLKTARLSAVVLILALALPLVVSVFPAYAAEAVNGHANVYVDAARPDNSGSGSSWSTAKKTIQAGIDLVDSTGTVHVAAGSYREFVHLGKSCTLSGAGALVTFIDGGGASQVVRVSSDVGQENTIEGFTIQNGYVGGNSAPAGMLTGGMPVGGGVYVAMYHTLSMVDCAIINNSSDFLGGGIYNAGRLFLIRCTVSGNSAGMVGGGIANFSDEGQTAFMDLSNCTIYGNRVTGSSFFNAPAQGSPGSEPEQLAGPPPLLGGGVFNGGDASYWSVTLAGNSVPSGMGSHGGGIANVPLQCDNDRLTLPAEPVKNRALYKNTIVAGNSPDNGYNDAETVVTSLGNNIDSQNNCGFTGIFDQVNTNPLLGPLRNNGGPTSTMAICTNSPAYNHGSSDIYVPVPLPTELLGEEPSPMPAVDQRGVSRPKGGAWDVGAFETVPISVSTLDAVRTGLKSATFNANLNEGTGGAPVSGYFEYGTSPGTYTGRTESQAVAAAGPFSVNVNDLPFGFCYFRAVASGDCVAYGQEKSLTILLPQDNGGGNSGTGTGTGQGSNPGGVNPTSASTMGLPQFTVTAAALSSASTAPGVPVTVTANIANKGTANGATSIKLYVNGREETSRGISVSSGASAPLSFTVSRDEPGTYSVYVGGTAAGSFTVEDNVGPNFILIASISLIVFALAAIIVLQRRKSTGI
jgi:hypothetical protein